jgi:membrane protein
MPNFFNLNGVPPKEIAQRTWAEMRTDDVFGRSAQLAYYFFLALFPFLICIIASLSIFGTADRGRALLFDLFERFLPTPAFQLISQAFNGIIQSSGPLKMSLGVVASLWSASLGMGAMMNTLNAAYNVQETRSLIKQYAVAIGLTCGIGLLLMASVIIVIFGDTITSAHHSSAFASIAWSVTRWLLALGAVFLALAATYFFAPSLHNPKWRLITPGSIVAVVLLVLVSVGSKAYIQFFGTYNLTYGSLGAVIVLLLCFYLSGVAVLSGGVLNAVLESASRNQSRLDASGTNLKRVL